MTTLFKNNAASTLSSGLAIAATSMNLVVGDNFPVVVAPDVVYVTIENSTVYEIVKITARALGSNAPTIVRAQEGTVARAWLTGDVVSLRWTGASAESGANAQVVGASALAAHAAAADPHPVYALDTAVTAELNAGLATKQPLDDQLTTLAAITATQATDLAALSAFSGTLLNDASQGAALTTLGAPLNVITALSANYTVVAADRGKLFDCTGTFTLSLTAAATLGAGFTFGVRNSGTGVITLDPNAAELVDGAATITYAASESSLVACNAAAWKTVGRSSAPNGAFRSTQIFSASGTYTKPTGLVRAKVTVVGGGGGGGSSQNPASVAASGGGGGNSTRWLEAASIGATETVTVPAAAAGGTASGNGAAGGTASFGTLLSATGGGGGAAEAGGIIAVPSTSAGVGSGGTVNGRGGVAAHIGSSILSVAPLIPVSGTVAGVAGVLGAGGSGARSDSGAAQSGGAGGAGIVIVEEFF